MEPSSPGRNPSRRRQFQTKNVHIWICLFQLCKVCFGSWGLRNHFSDSTAQTAMQQHVVEHKEHDKALKKAWSSTASGLSSRCLDTVLPLDPARSERECTRLSLTIIQFTAHVILIIYTQQQQAHIRKPHKKPSGDGRAAKQQVRNTGSCSCGPAHRRLGSIWSLSLRIKQYGEFGSRTERLSRPF